MPGRYYAPKFENGEVVVSHWSGRHQGYVGHTYYSGYDAQDRAIAYADTISRQMNGWAPVEYQPNDVIQVLVWDGQDYRPMMRSKPDVAT